MVFELGTKERLVPFVFFIIIGDVLLLLSMLKNILFCVLFFSCRHISVYHSMWICAFMKKKFLYPNVLLSVLPSF